MLLLCALRLCLSRLGMPDEDCPRRGSTDRPQAHGTGQGHGGSGIAGVLRQYEQWGVMEEIAKKVSEAVKKNKADHPGEVDLK